MVGGRICRFEDGVPGLEVVHRCMYSLLTLASKEKEAGKNFFLVQCKTQVLISLGRVSMLEANL